jgi:hypothetical protein
MRRALPVMIAALALLVASCGGDRGDGVADQAGSDGTPPAPTPATTPAPARTPTPTATPPPAVPPTTAPTVEPTPDGAAVRVVRLGLPFAISPSEAVDVEGAGTRIRFVRVVQDSRCPTDVTCIRAGDVTLELLVEIDGKQQTVELALGDRGEPTVTLDALTITLLEVEPKPISTRTIDPSAYVATLTVVMIER